MMRRLLWMGAGIGVGVGGSLWLVRATRRAARRYLPAPLSARVARLLDAATAATADEPARAAHGRGPGAPGGRSSRSAGAVVAGAALEGAARALRTALARPERP